MIYGITGPVASGKTRNMLRLLNDGNYAGRPVFVANAWDSTVNVYTQSRHPDVHIGIPEGETLANWPQWLPENSILIVENAASALMAFEEGNHEFEQFVQNQTVFLIDTNLDYAVASKPKLKQRIQIVEVVRYPHTHPFSDCQVLMAMDQGSPLLRSRILLGLLIGFILRQPGGFIDYLLRSGFAGYKGHEVEFAAERVSELTSSHYLPLPDGCTAEFIYMAELLNRCETTAAHHRHYHDIIYQVLYAVADGSRRPGSWERGMLESMGLAADCAEHQVYRIEYGRPVEG